MRQQVTTAAAALGFVISSSLSAGAYMIEVELTCPLGGESFNAAQGVHHVGKSQPLALNGLEVSGLWRDTVKCPNGFPMHRKFSASERARIPHLPPLPDTSYWQKVLWVETKLGTLTPDLQENILREIALRRSWLIDLQNEEKVRKLRAAYRAWLPSLVGMTEKIQPKNADDYFLVASDTAIIAYLKMVLGDENPQVWLDRSRAALQALRNAGSNERARIAGDAADSMDRRLTLLEICHSVPAQIRMEVCEPLNSLGLGDIWAATQPDFHPVLSSSFDQYFGESLRRFLKMRGAILPK